MREKSSSAFTSFSSRSGVAMQAISQTLSSRERVVRARSAASSAGPSINVSGVRNSWLTLLKNAVLARSISASASARRRASSSATALLMAVAM